MEGPIHFSLTVKGNINSPLSQASISLLSSVTIQNLSVCPAGGVCWVGVGKLTYCSFYSQQCSCAKKTHESDILPPPPPPSPNVHTIKSTTLKTTQVKITELNHAAHRVLNRLLLQLCELICLVLSGIKPAAIDDSGLCNCRQRGAVFSQCGQSSSAGCQAAYRK